MIPDPERQKRVNLPSANLVYLASSRPVRAKSKDPISITPNQANEQRQVGERGKEGGQ